MKRRFIRLNLAAITAVCSALFLLPGNGVCAAGWQILQGHVPKAVGGLQPVGQVDDNTHLKLAIGLPLRNQQGLTSLLQQIYDPKSPNYHQYLSVEEFTASFGPSEADYRALRDFVRSNGLVETQTHPNRMVLGIYASAADIRRVFHVNLRNYYDPLQKRQFFAPDTEPSLDLAVPVLHISGLDNYVLPHPLSHRLTDKNGRPTPLGGGGTNAPLSGSGPGGYYLGYDFRNAYAPGVTLTGTGQNAALFEYDGYYTSDIIAYEQLAGLPNVNLINVPIDGGIIGAPGGGVGEVSLDIEMVIAMAPGISNLYIYESPGGPEDDVLNRMATDNSSKQISASWVFGIDGTTDQIFQEFAAQGQSFYQASGDSDAYVGPIAPPEDDPYITLVGGTELVMNGTGASYASESVWNIGYQPPGGAPQFENYWGSGGGISTTYLIPAWQQGVSMAANGGSTVFRNTPDVAMTADNIWVIAGDQTQTGAYGGTSCAAPLWCGFTALINQQAISNSLPSVGFINPAVYAIGQSASYSACFHDTTQGNNIWPGSGGLFSAVPGYDLCTGWGTPAGSSLIDSLIPSSLAVLTNIVTGGNGNGVIDFDECNDLTIILTNKGTNVVTGVVATLSSTTIGAIVAQGTSSYPAIFGHSTAANLNAFTLSTEPTFVCGTPVNLTLVVKSDQGIQTNFIQLPSGVVGPPVSFGNATPYTISDSNTIPVSSPVVVSNLQALGKVTVSLYLEALFDYGITLELTSPSGTNVLLSQDNFGTGPNFENYGQGCATNLETTFDDAASTSIANGSAPFVGSFQPQQPLSVYKLASGTNLNGIWTLEVQNIFLDNPAVLECWSLNISPEYCVDGGGQCPGADLSLTMSASPNPVFEGSNLVYTLMVSNAGPGTADSVIISQILPAGVGFVSAIGSSSTVTASVSGSNLNLLLGSMPVYGTNLITVTTIPTIPGFITSTATVGSQDTDPNPNNNTASATVLVSQPTADLAVSMTGLPGAVLQGQLVTYTITVTNNGPFTAEGVNLTTTLPTNVNLITAATSQGTLSFGGAFASLGTIPVGTNVVVTIEISPTLTGSITASTVVALSPLEVDPNTLNNFASVTTTVGPAADLAVTAVATPSPVVAGSNVSYVATITNSGPSGATGVVFSQSIPVGATFISSSLGGVTISNNSISASVGNLASGGSILVTDLITSVTLPPGVKSQNMISTFSVFGQPGDPNTNNNSVTLQTIAELPTVTIVAAGAIVTSGSSNGSVGPTGTYGVQLYLQNAGTIPTTNLVATLLSTNGVTLPVPGGALTYGVLAPGAAPTSGQYSFTANSTNGGTIVATLQLQDGTNNLGTVAFDFVMPVAKTFWNTNFISIPNQIYIPAPDSGPANPYPSAIVVSNVTGVVSTVTVTVSNLFHTYPDDIGMLLVGPSGASCVLMSAAADFSTMTSAATVTFAQSAAIVLPANGTIASGSYQPADYYVAQYGKTETYSNSPVPVGPYNANLAIFDSVQANGTWSLYIEDDTAGDAGAISNGWGLTITTTTPVNQVADLAATIVALTNQVVLGNNITNIWTVTNNGPDAVTNVFSTNILSSGLTLLTNGLPAGATTLQTGQVNVYNLGVLAAGSGLAVTNVVTTTASGPQTNLISVASFVLDNDPVNNTASVVTTVVPPPADLAVGPISVSPSSAVINSNIVYTMYVTNNGPSNAFSVVGLFTNTSSLLVISAVPSQGNCVTNTGFVQCNLGTISNGEFAVVTVTATAQALGIVTNVWSVSTTCEDTNLSNNSATAKVTVTQPIAIITNGPATLLSQAAAPFNGAINSNQTNTVAFTLLNIGSGPTTNLVATLQANSGIRPITTSNVYGAIAPGGSASQSYTFVGSGNSGATLSAVLSLRDGSNTNLAPVSYSFMIPVTQSFTNSTEILINQFGPASPYPSEIPIATLTNGSNNLLVSKVTATLNGFAHTWPHDVEAVLVSPGGQEVVLMEHAGSYYSVSNLVFTFEDAASQGLPANTLSSGVFLATQYSPFDAFPSLAPVSATSTNLAFFNGTTANGPWSLYVYDDTEGNGGVITGGWVLNLTAVSPVNPAARLLASTIEAPNPAIGGDYLDYQITVSNEGPGIATNVVLTDVLPASTALISSAITLSQGSYTNSGGTVTCNFGTLNVGASAAAIIKVIVEAGGGLITNTATATTGSTDLYPTDGISITATEVTGTQAPYLSAAILSDGKFQLAVDGYVGQAYAIQVSTNLLTWTTISTNTGAFTNLYSTTNVPQSFYRAIQLPQ